MYQMDILLLTIRAEDLAHDEDVELVGVSDTQCPRGYGSRLGYNEPLCERAVLCASLPERALPGGGLMHKGRRPSNTNNMEKLQGGLPLWDGKPSTRTSPTRDQTCLSATLGRSGHSKSTEEVTACVVYS